MNIYIITFLIGMAVFFSSNVIISRIFNHLRFVNGKHCRVRPFIRYMLADLFVGLAAAGCVLNYGYTFRAVMGFAFLIILMAIAMVDMDTMMIPNGFVIAVLIIGVISILTFPEISVLQRVGGLVAVSGPLLIITMMVPGAFGGGDIKLMAASGIFLGWRLNLIALFVALLTGGAYSIYLLAVRKKGRKEHFAFGPFLCVGMAFSLFLIQ